MERLSKYRIYLIGRQAGLSLCAGAVHGTAWELEEVRGNAVKTMLTLAAISTVASLQVFGKDRLIFWRESASGERQGHNLAFWVRMCVFKLP